MLLFMLLPGLFVSGQVKFTTVVSSQEVGRGDYLQIEYVVENAKQIDQLNPPDFPGFTVMQGPMQSSGMSVINGNSSQYRGLSFVLQPLKTGKFTIQGASALVDGKKMQSKPVTITVTASSSGNSGKNNNAPVSPFSQLGWPDPTAANPLDIDREYYLKPGENSKDKIRKNLFVKVQVDKTTCFVGEPIVATYKLYSRLNSESRVTRRPSLNGFSVYDMVDPGSDAASVEKLNGKPFVVHIIRKTQLIPLQAGMVELDPVELENTVHFIKGRQQARSSGDPLKDLFDQMSDDNASGPEVEENVTLDTKPVAITVKPLPEGNKPVSFNGAVGNFSMQAALANKSIGAQDEATLRLVVKGSGNLPVITAPQVQWPSGIDAYDPIAHEDINKAVVPMKGSKTFDYTFSPRAGGHYTIPPIAFSYFDPADQSYKKIESAPMDFQVTPSFKKPGTRSLPAMISAAPSMLERAKNFMQQHLESIFAILILSAIALYLWRQNRRLKETGREEAMTAKKELKTSGADEATVNANRKVEPVVPPVSSYPRSTMTVTPVDPLYEARQRFYNGDYTGFYRELNRAVWKAVSDRLNLPGSELNKVNMSRQLEARGWNADTTRSLENILNECEMNLYTPAYDTYNMQQLLKQAESLLSVLVPDSSY